MELYPAIDLRDGRCVRLRQGDFADETVYGDDPVAIARGFAAAGCRWIHVVDLDAARTGVPANRAVVAAIAAAVAPDGVAVQSGGGVRSPAAAEALFAAGVARVVVGTAAVRDPALVGELVADAPAGGVAVGVDARRGDGGTYEVAVDGWTHGAGRELLDVVAALEDQGAAALVVTEIGRDGMLCGPDLDGLAAVLVRTAVPLIASGGVATLADLADLAGLEVAGRRLAGAITGKAIYEGRFSVEAALVVLAEAGAGDGGCGS